MLIDLDGLAELPVRAALRSDDLLGQFQDVVRQRIGDIRRVSGGRRVVPAVHEQTERQNARQSPHGRFVAAPGDGAVQSVTSMEGVQGGPADGDDLTLDGVVSVAWRKVGVQGRADRRDRVDQVIGQLGHVEISARRLPRQVVGRDRVHDVLQHSQRCFGGAKFVGGR